MIAEEQIKCRWPLQAARFGPACRIGPDSMEMTIWGKIFDRWRTAAR